MNADTEDEIADIDPTPADVEKWRASLPPEVLKEIEGEENAQTSEMIHKFEMHAMEYENEHPESVE